MISIENTYKQLQKKCDDKYRDLLAKALEDREKSFVNGFRFVRPFPKALNLSDVSTDFELLIRSRLELLMFKPVTDKELILVLSIAKMQDFLKNS